MPMLHVYVSREIIKCLQKEAREDDCSMEDVLQDIITEAFTPEGPQNGAKNEKTNGGITPNGGSPHTRREVEGLIRLRKYRLVGPIGKCVKLEKKSCLICELAGRDVDVSHGYFGTFICDDLKERQKSVCQFAAPHLRAMWQDMIEEELK